MAAKVDFHIIIGRQDREDREDCDHCSNQGDRRHQA